MSVEGDARPERQSSSPSPALSPLRSKAPRFARLALAGFILLHLAVEAFRAHADATRPEPGLEQEPAFVAAMLVIVWLPLALLAAHELRRPRSGAKPAARSEKERALAVAERLALLAVLLFTLWHGAQVAWPLLSGSSVAADLRPDLILTLSTTWHGLPVAGAVYLCAVGASSFYAVRQARAALPHAPRLALRAVVLLGVLCYALGSYAVIRCASGPIFP